jgi:hypothetical protein
MGGGWRVQVAGCRVGKAFHLGEAASEAIELFEALWESTKVDM